MTTRTRGTTAAASARPPCPAPGGGQRPPGRASPWPACPARTPQLCFHHCAQQANGFLQPIKSRSPSTAWSLLPAIVFFCWKVSKNPSVHAMLFFQEWGLSWLCAHEGAFQAWAIHLAQACSAPRSASATQHQGQFHRVTHPAAAPLSLDLRRWPASSPVVIVTLFAWPFRWSRSLRELKNASSPSVTSEGKSS